MVARIPSLATPRLGPRRLSGGRTALLGSVLLGGFLVGSAEAQTAAPQPAAPQPERCEGTLCDLYYSTRSTPAASDTAAGSAAAPASGGLTNWFKRGPGPTNAQPTAPASSSNGYMALGAGGVLGGKQERCSGTLCDLYYGSSPSEAPGTQQASAAAAPPTVEPVTPHRHIVHESETRPKCSAPTADPWHCYR